MVGIVSLRRFAQQSLVRFPALHGPGQSQRDCRYLYEMLLQRILLTEFFAVSCFVFNTLLMVLNCA